MIQYPLHLRYTSLQVYRLLFEKFPMSSLSFLNKIQQGENDALKTLKILYEKGFFSRDCILIIYEIYRKKSAECQSGQYIGIEKEGNFYKKMVEFMAVGLKQSRLFVVQTIPEITFSRQ